VRARGVTGAPVAGVRGRVATSLFGGVTAGLGIARTRWEGVAGRLDGKRVGSGLTMRGATSPLDGATVGGAEGAGVCARGALSRFGRVTAGSGSA
jgi:hypothetical protein